MHVRNLIWAVFILFFLTQPSANAKRWALLIGVNDYTSPFIRDLRGCKTDVRLMSEVLIDRFGFTADDIKILLDGEATHDGIINTFNDWLIAKPKSGDVVVFYFSGHGSRAVDESGDELDGWDEVLCPADLIPSSNRQRFLNAILDDELGTLLDLIPTNNVTVILDSCNSGTATKALIDAGLTIPKMVDRDLILKPRTPPPSHGRDSSAVEQTNMNHVFISGSLAEETSLDAMWPMPEGQRFFAGVLTKNLVDLLRKVRTDTPYADLESEVRKAVKRRSHQTPQFEGDLSRPLFGTQNPDGTFSPLVVGPTKPYVLVTRIEGKNVTINEGAIHGVTERSVYEVFSPTEVSFTGNPLALMRITAVSQDYSSGEILKSGITIAPMCRAVESSHAYPPDKLYLQIRGSGEATSKSKLQAALSQMADLEVVEYGRYADVVLEVDEDSDRLTGRLTSDDGIQFDKVVASDAAALVAQLRPQLENALVIKKLGRLSNPNPPFKIQIWMEGKGERPVYEVGEVAVFKFKSEQTCYLTLLNVDTQGKITMLFPNKYHPSNEIAANDVYTIPSPSMDFRIRAQAPAGKQLLKAIATTTPASIPEFDLNRTKEIFLSVGGIAEVNNFTKSLGRTFAVEAANRDSEGSTHLPTSRWVTSELIAEIR